MISIIMGTYNGERFLREQLDSILSQEETNWKLYIFDDGSKDKTEFIAKEYEKRYPEKIFFFKNKENHGAKGNFFQGLNRVFRELNPESEYVAFSDQDDVWYENKLSLVLSKMKEMEREKKLPSAVFSDVRLTDWNLKEKADSYFEAAGLDETKVDFASLLMENKAIGGTMLINRALIEKELSSEKREKSYPKKAKMHDWWFMLMAAAFGKIGYVKEPTEAYRQHESNVVGGASFFAYLKERVLRFREIKGRLDENVSQGEEFLRFFEKDLSEESLRILKDFVRLKESGFFGKRTILIKHRFYKSGFIRNLALFIFI